MAETLHVTAELDVGPLEMVFGVNLLLRIKMMCK